VGRRLLLGDEAHRGGSDDGKDLHLQAGVVGVRAVHATQQALPTRSLLPPSRNIAPRTKDPSKPREGRWPVVCCAVHPPAARWPLGPSGSTPS
jgi:hypothetical protein